LESLENPGLWPLKIQGIMQVLEDWSVRYPTIRNERGFVCKRKPVFTKLPDCLHKVKYIILFRASKPKKNASAIILQLNRTNHATEPNIMHQRPGHTFRGKAQDPMYGSMLSGVEVKNLTLVNPWLRKLGNIRKNRHCPLIVSKYRLRGRKLTINNFLHTSGIFVDGSLIRQAGAIPPKSPAKVFPIGLNTEGRKIWNIRTEPGQNSKLQLISQFATTNHYNALRRLQVKPCSSGSYPENGSLPP